MKTDIAAIVVRALAAVLSGAALLRWGRAGWGLLSAGLSVALAGLVFEINGRWMTRFDTSVEFLVRPHRSPGALAASEDLFTVLGNPAYFAAAVLVCGTVLALRARSAVPVGVLVAAVGAGVVLESILKSAVGRTAASVAALQLPGPRSGPVAISYLHSFPSGHVTGTAAFLGMVAVFLGMGRRPEVKARLAALIAAAVVLLGLLAVYCRAHTASDVLGGMVLGGAVVAVSAAVLTAAAHRMRRVPSGTAVTHARAGRRRPGGSAVAHRAGGVLVG